MGTITIIIAFRDTMLTITDKKPIAHSAPAGGMPAAYTSTPVTGVQAVGVHTVTLEDMGRKLMRQKWTLLLTALSIVILTAYITWTTPPTYRAGGTIQIEKNGAQVVNFGTVTAATPDIGEQDPFFRTQYEQLKSRKLAEKVIDTLNLRQRLFERPVKPSLLKTFSSFVKDMIALLPFVEHKVSAPAPVKTDYVTEFSQSLFVEPIEKTHLVKVFFESQDPILSADIVNGVINTFIKENINQQTETDSYAKDFLEQELEKARVRLTMQEAKLIDYAKQNNILEVNNSQSTQEKKLDDLYGALAQAERNRIQIESQMLQSRQHGNVREVLNNPVVEGIKKNLMELEAQYQEKLKMFKPAYPDMQLLQQQIDETKRQLKKETNGLQQSLQADYASAKKLEDDLRQQLDAYKNELISLRDNSIEYNALKREVETSRNLYDGLLQRMKEVSVASNITTSNIKVVDAAAAVNEIFRPKKSLNLIIGSLVGLMLGIGAALLRETLNQTVASVNELQSLSGLPVLGTIPWAKNLSDSNLAMATIRDVGSSLAEAYRVATANLRFVLPGGRAPRTILLTSANPAEGKSTSAVNIAISQAQHGMKVLLIDADLRKPSVHFKMGLSNAKGLSNFLAGDVDIASVTQGSREVKGLYLVSAGTLISDPVKMLASPALAQLLNLAARHFDSIIIDGPPVIGFADALYLSALVQATVLVADEDHINRKRLINAIEQLRRVRNNVVGFLMVRSQEDVMDYRHYDRYQKCMPSRKKVKKVNEETGAKPVKSKTKRKGLNLAHMF